MKLTLKESFVLAEARDPSLKYSAKEVKKKIEKIVVQLEGNKSGVMTKLAKAYFELDKSIKSLEEERDELNKKLKAEVEGLFDAEDIIYTRIVETCTFIATLNKVSAPKDKVEVNYEKIIEELTKLVPAELTANVDEIRKTYTTISKVEPKSPGFKTEPKLESLAEGVADVYKKVKQLVGSLIKSITRWAISYDKKLAKLKLAAGA
jgi:predicted  nucleic acid-binding Zn-ribbon protein